MAKKGLDSTFLHYGIRRDDMAIIETLCTKHELNFEWVKEDLLRAYHERKISNQNLDDKAVERMIEKALQKIN